MIDFCRVHGFAIVLLTGLMACSRSAAPDQPPAAVTRSLGAWQGRGSQTIGIVSESGRLRVRWETKNETPAGAGAFRLALHSAVSGRPIQLIADIRGESRGAVDVAEDPRPYNFMVESTNVDWSFAVEEIIAGRVRP